MLSEKEDHARRNLQKKAGRYSHSVECKVRGVADLLRPAFFLWARVFIISIPKPVQRSPFLPLLGLVILTALACSGLKLDKESNCLNDKAACYKEDKTRPRVHSFETSPVRDGADSVPELAHIDVTFTEEIKDGDLAATYKFVKNASVHNFSVTSVQRLSTYTYRLLVSGSLSSTGSVELDIAPLKDYNNNSMDTAVPVAFTGNVNIPIRSSVNHNGVSTTGGYASVQLKFHHEYTADLTNANSYEVRLTSGAIDCTIGSVLASGSNLAPDFAAGGPNEITVNVPAATFTSGINRLVICISNANNPNAANRASALIIRDDVAPVLTYTPAGGSYKDHQAITVSCSNNPDKIAYTSTTQQGLTPPADPVSPTFDPATGNIVTGNPYGTGITAENPTNPTYTKFIWRCIDIAGNLSTALATPVQFYIDNTIPGVTVNFASGYRQYVSTVNPTSTLVFSTDQISKTYNIRRNGTTCDAGGDGTLLATGTTPATAGQPTPPIPLDITTHFTTANTTYPVRICVAGTGIQWGTAYLEITRDDTVPTITPSVVTGNYGALQSVQFTCDDTFGSVHKVAYDTTVADGLTLPALPAVPVYNTSTGDITNGIEQTTALSPEDRRTTRYTSNCIDRAGNVATAGSTRYTIDATLPIVNFVSLSRSAVSGNAGAYGDTTVTFTSSRAGLTYRIRRVANCDHSGTPAETLLPDATISAANANQSAILPASAFPSNGVSYPLRICVYNLLGASSHQTVSLNVTRDDSSPATVTGLTVTAATTTSVTLGWTAATDVGPAGVSGYRIYQRTSAGAYVPTTFYTSSTNSVNISGLNTSDTYYFVVRAIDNAGNLSVADSNEVQSRFTLSVMVAGYSSALNGPFRVQLGAGEILLFTANGTQTFSQVFLSGDTYTLPIIAQPATQNCAFVGNQYGTMTASATLQVTCVSGYSSGGGLIANKPAPLNYLLYRGNAQVVAGNGGGTACAGSNNANCRDGVELLAQFSNPHGMTIANGFIYIADRSNNRIRRFDTNLYATTTSAGEGSPGTIDSTNPLTARFDAPQAITTDGVNLYVVEAPAGIGHLRKINIVSGNVTTLAGGGTQSGGTLCSGSNTDNCVDGTGAQVKFNGANGIVYHNGFLYITEFSNNRVRRMNLATGVVDTIAGNGATASGADNVAGASTSFSGATGAAVVGNQLYVADFNGHRIRAVSLTAPFTVTAVAGTGTAGHADGPLASARFYNPDHLTTDGYNLFVTEYAGDGQTGRRLRRIDLRKGRVSTIAGNSQAEAQGIGAAAAFGGPVGVVSDGRQLFVAAYDSGRIFRVTDSGLVGYWPLAAGENANNYSSATATTLDGSFVSAPFSTQADRYGNANGALAFNGTNQRITVGTSAGLPNGNNPRTMCTWVKPSILVPGNQLIATYGANSTNQSFGLYLRQSGGVNGAGLTAYGGPTDVVPAYTTSTAHWTHLCAWTNSSEARVYVNGHLMASAARNFSTTAGTLSIGSEKDTFSPFSGAIADLRIYDRALSEGEINELAQDASSDTAITGSGLNNGAAGLLAHYEVNPGPSNPQREPSGPIGTTLTASGSYPIGIHGDAGTGRTGCPVRFFWERERHNGLGQQCDEHLCDPDD